MAGNTPVEKIIVQVSFFGKIEKKGLFGN
jgi:hypothetical protein